MPEGTDAAQGYKYQSMPRSRSATRTGASASPGPSYSQRLSVARNPVIAGVWRRFRWAWGRALQRSKTPQAIPAKTITLAIRLGVHPTALAPSNFKLNRQHLQDCAELFQVDADFLIDGALPATEHLDPQLRDDQVRWELLQSACALIHLSRSAAEFNSLPTVVDCVQAYPGSAALAALHDLEVRDHRALQLRLRWPGAWSEFSECWDAWARLLREQLDSKPSIRLPRRLWQAVQHSLLQHLGQHTIKEDDPHLQALLAVQEGLRSTMPQPVTAMPP
jgi:hypothetical protein